MKTKNIKRKGGDGAHFSIRGRTKSVGALRKGKIMKKRNNGKSIKYDLNSVNATVKKERNSSKAIHKPRESCSKRKLRKDDGLGGSKKKLRVEKLTDHKEERMQPRLEKKDLKVLRRRKKQNYELTLSLIKKYESLRR